MGALDLFEKEKIQLEQNQKFPCFTKHNVYKVLPDKCIEKWFLMIRQNVSFKKQCL